MPTRSERIRERSDTSSEPSSIGMCTRRPSLVTTTATRRRSGRFKAPTVRAVYVPIRLNATACTRSVRPIHIDPDGGEIFGRRAWATPSRVAGTPPSGSVRLRFCQMHRSRAEAPRGSRYAMSTGVALNRRSGRTMISPVVRRISSSIFVGRMIERAQLEAGLDAAEQGEAGLVRP